MVTRAVFNRDGIRVSCTIVSEGFADLLEFLQIEFADCKLLDLVTEGEDK